MTKFIEAIIDIQDESRNNNGKRLPSAYDILKL